MVLNLGDVAAGSTLYVPFATYNSSGASVTITGLAATDIEIYKDGSVTQRASDAGYTLLDTDGIDFDGITGIHGFSIDLADNTTAGFYTAGSTYWLVVSAITVDSQTVNFVYYFTISSQIIRGALSGTHSTTTADLGTFAPANDITGQILVIPAHNFSAVIDSYNTGTGVATFSPATAATLANGNLWFLIPAPRASTGTPLPANVTQWLGTAPATPTVAGVPEVDLTHVAGSTTDVSTIPASIAAILVDTGTTLDGRIPAALVGGRMDATVDGTGMESGAVNAILDAALADSVPADGALPTVRQAIYMVTQFLTERSVSGTTLTIRKVDGSTALMTFTLSDATSPTSVTRTT